MFDRAFTAKPSERPSVKEWSEHCHQLLTGQGLQRCGVRPPDPAHIHFAGKPCGACHFEGLIAGAKGDRMIRVVPYRPAPGGVTSTPGSVVPTPVVSPPPSPPRGDRLKRLARKPAVRFLLAAGALLGLLIAAALCSSPTPDPLPDPPPTPRPLASETLVFKAHDVEQSGSPNGTIVSGRAYVASWRLNVPGAVSVFVSRATGNTWDVRSAFLVACRNVLSGTDVQTCQDSIQFAEGTPPGTREELELIFVATRDVLTLDDSSPTLGEGLLEAIKNVRKHSPADVQALKVGVVLVAPD
jgi:hypothetical protein